MGNFSKPPHEVLTESVDRGYVGLHVEQGVPVLDRDLNLLQDLIAATVQNVVARYIGSGVAEGDDGFRIEAIPEDNEFRISAGRILVDGIEITNPTPKKYGDQPGPPAPVALSAPNLASGSDPRTDTVYVDVWLDEVDGADPGHGDLLNDADVGVQTSVRLIPKWTVKVAPGESEPPPPAAGHHHLVLAYLKRPNEGDVPDAARITKGRIEDRRNTHLTLAAFEGRLRTIEERLLVPVFAARDWIDPNFGVGGDAATLKGVHFGFEPVTVTFDGVDLVVTGVRPDEIDVVLPTYSSYPHTGTFTVTTADGKLPPAVSPEYHILTGNEPPPAPGVLLPIFDADPFEPNFVEINSSLTIQGENFGNSGIVKIGSVEFETGSEIVATDWTPTAITFLVQGVTPGTSHEVKVIPTGTDEGDVESRNLLVTEPPP